jgi:hypothetical protein
MRKLILALVTSAALGPVLALPASAGCAVNGDWCDYPNWAANAFDSRDGTVVDEPSTPTVVHHPVRHRAR